MSVVTNPVTMPATHAEAGKEDNYLTHSSGFLSWALTLDHKRIGTDVSGWRDVGLRTWAGYWR